MTPEKRAEAITLANDIQEDLSRLNQVYGVIEDDVELLRKDASAFQQVPKRYVVDATAGHIHDFYTGIEQIYERIIIFTEGKKPSGQDFHKQVLKVVHETLKLTDEDEKAFLDDLRGFRHVFRKGYGIEMDPARVEPKALTICTRWDGIRQKIVDYQKRLRQDPPGQAQQRI